MISQLRRCTQGHGYCSAGGRESKDPRKGTRPMRRLWILTVAALAVTPAAFADTYRHGRIRHVEEGVSIQRGTDTGSEEAVANMPYLPGDRVWTDDGGRVEFQFG